MPRSRKRVVAVFVACVSAGVLAVVSEPLALSLVAPGQTAAESSTPEVTPTTVAAATPAAIPAPTPTPMATPTPTASPTLPAPTQSPTPTDPVSEPAVLSEVRVLPGTEPDIAASPYRRGLVAVVSQNVSATGCGRPAVSISKDSGVTWSDPGYPWRATCQDKHATIAWGPGPGPGTSRLWATNAVSSTGGMLLSVTHSDDLGRTWTRPFVSRFTPPWSGCFPTIAVDNISGSPNFGTVYVAYNWLVSPQSVGIAVIATRDGVTWQHAEVPVAPYPGFPFAWRFGYRLAVTPNGSAYVSFYEDDMAHWNAADIWEVGAPSNSGRAGFATSRISFAGSLSAAAPVWATNVHASTSAIFDPECQSQLVADGPSGLWLILSDRPGTGGVVMLGHSVNAAQGWTWRNLNVPGTEGFKASLAVWDGRVIALWHAMDRTGLVETFYSVSRDDGLTFEPPQKVTASSFKMPAIVNGTGLRESAVAADGIAYYAWGDDRSDLAIYVAAISF